MKKPRCLWIRGLFRFAMSEPKKKLPKEIATEYERQRAKMGWPGIVPGYCEFIKADGKTYFCQWKNITVSVCEQAAEWRIRQAMTTIKTFEESGTLQAARKAGKAILYARIYKAKSLLLMGAKDVWEDDLPFPYMEHDAT